jgi:hypothetical protein
MGINKKKIYKNTKKNNRKYKKKTVKVQKGGKKPFTAQIELKYYNKNTNKMNIVAQDKLYKLVSATARRVTPKIATVNRDSGVLVEQLRTNVENLAPQSEKRLIFNFFEKNNYIHSDPVCNLENLVNIDYTGFNNKGDRKLVLSFCDTAKNLQSIVTVSSDAKQLKNFFETINSELQRSFDDNAQQISNTCYVRDTYGKHKWGVFSIKHKATDDLENKEDVVDDENKNNNQGALKIDKGMIKVVKTTAGSEPRFYNIRDLSRIDYWHDKRNNKYISLEFESQKIKLGSIRKKTGSETIKEGLLIDVSHITNIDPLIEAIKKHNISLNCINNPTTVKEYLATPWESESGTKQRTFDIDPIYSRKNVSPSNIYPLQTYGMSTNGPNNPESPTSPKQLYKRDEIVEVKLRN